MLKSIFINVLVMALLGWPSLAMPFRGDEALFAIYAQQMNEGGKLYADYWDITNPGIFCFYFAGGKLFGFTETGIRIFEWIWMTGFVFTVAEAGRRSRGEKHWSVWPAILLGGLYYCAGYSQTGTFTKTEGLVAWPLFVAIWLAVRGVQENRIRWLIMAGIAGGIVVLFKLMFMAVVGLAWLSLLLFHLRGKPQKLRLCVRTGLWLGLGTVLMLGCVYGYLAYQGSAKDLYHTLVELPPQFLAEGQRADMERLAVSGKWFLGQYALGLAFAFVCALWHRDAIVISCAIALVSACGAILAQRLSWWPYHFLLPGSLAAGMAGYALPTLLNRFQFWINTPLPRRGLYTAYGFVFILLLEPLGALGFQYARIAKFNFGLHETDREKARYALGTAYAEALDEMAVIAKQPEGEVFVCGDPLFYWLGHKKPACRISGWSLELYPEALRNELTDEVKARKPLYVYVSAMPHGYDKLLARKYPDLFHILETKYQRLHTTRLGVWYVLK